MQTRSSTRTAAFCGELPTPSTELAGRDKRQVLTSVVVEGRLLKIYRVKVEQLAIAFENSGYQVPAAVLSAAIVGEHMGAVPF